MAELKLDISDLVLEAINFDLEVGAYQICCVFEAVCSCVLFPGCVSEAEEAE